MGVGASVSRSTGSFSHRHGGADHQARLKRVDYRNVDASSAANKCGMCQLKVDLGTVAYLCREEGCPLLLHAACYRRPKTLRRHLAHPDHRLTLHAADGGHCGICTLQLGLGAPAFAYRCTSAGCAGFQAHPRCCDLPPEITTGHAHGRLVLRPAPSGRRHCLKCKRTAKTGARAPWSYQCLSCDKEVCVACLLSNDGRADSMQCCCCCVRWCDVASPGVVHCLGQAAGVFLCGLATGMGCPTGFAAPTTWRIENVNGDN